MNEVAALVVFEWVFRIQADREMDETTPNAGEYHFEKMVSGMYMGEVARRIILQLAVQMLTTHCAQKAALPL